MKVSEYLAAVIGGYCPFVVQGGAAVHLIDSVARAGHRYVCCAHEQAAGFAADGYAKVRGLGVAITTCGPGATNLLTAAASAYFERVPVLYLVGQQHVFQEMDLVSMFRPVTRYAKQVTDPETVPAELAHALRATRGGPVMLNIFDEVYYSEITPFFPGPDEFKAPPWSPSPADHIFGNKRNALTEVAFEEKTVVNPYRFVRELEAYPCSIVTDIGNHGVWVKQAHPAAIADNNFGAMGYGIAASMGVAAAGKTAACVTGDGSIQMNIQELATIAKHEMDIKIFVLNNGGYGMIKNTQDKWLQSRYSGCDLNDLPLVDFERVATAYGIPNRRWESHEDIDFNDVFAMKGPMLINVVIDPKQGVY